MEVTWFRHSHENRNDLLRFGLMRLHYAGQIRYVEKPFADMTSAGFSPAILTYPDPRHHSFIQVKEHGRKLKCMVDSEDSFALISPLISEVDLCFCAGYNSDFFERRQFVKLYNWQTESDIAWYKQTMEQKLESCGDQFWKIKKFIPIAPNQGAVIPNSRFKQKYKNLLQRLDRLMGKGENFSDTCKGFELRHACLLELRNNSLQYDIVLNDSLWGWPQHRINLHQQLKCLYNDGFAVHSILNWTPQSVCDGSEYNPVSPGGFPLRTGLIDHPYEQMLSQSRLAVFACGFHWGWRNILMLALQAGIPVLTDRLLTEAYFDMNEFELEQVENNNWVGLPERLRPITPERWAATKKHNTAVYDKYMQPEAVANYFLQAVSAN